MSITPLSKEVISRQATINIGTIGHVAHGKSTIVKAITGVHTVRFKAEKERNITIKLGYANAKIFRCKVCPRPDCFKSAPSSAPDEISCSCGSSMILQRHVSFVDCPGHDVLMATMLNGAAIMDSAILLIAGNEVCPQPQTAEHLAAIEIMGLNNIIILQNKVDLLKEVEAATQYDQIKNFVQGTSAEKAPIIPISAQHQYNIDVLCEYITRIPIPVRDFTSAPRMMVVRSFDINRPGEEIDTLKGGVAGGSILRGIFRIGQDIEIRPGIIERDADGVTRCTPLRTRVTSLNAEANSLDYAVPGGLIGMGTLLVPSLTRSDKLVGHVIGIVDTLPEVYQELEVNYFLLRKLLGVKSDKTRIKPLEKGEVLMVNIGSTAAGGRVIAIKNDMVKIALTHPVCTEVGEKIALSRRVSEHWRLVGWGKIIKGK